jgi:2,7-dihydroxy-5-methyl-1-naphthoate 7-O-methyltransferase
MGDLTDLLTPWCVHTVATLKIAERIDGVAEVGELAAVAECDREALHDVLSHLVSKGVFEEPSPGRFALNDAARELFAASAFLSLDGIGGRMAYAWSTLPTYVKTGRPGYADVFGLPFWEDLAAHPDVAASFDDLIGPGGHGAPDARVDLRDGWEGIRTVVDVGGGTGAMLSELVRRHPGLHGVLFDLPEVVAGVEPPAAVEVVSGDFLAGVPAGEAYVVSRILHGLDDVKAALVLANIRAAARPGACVLLIEAVIPGGNAPNGSKWLDLLMLVLTGGRERTEEEWRALLARAGLAVVSIEDGLIQARCP